MGAIKHIGFDPGGALSMLSVVRLCNSGEQTGTAHHFYSLCSSTTCPNKLSTSRILENSFETRNWGCEFYQGTGLCFESAFWNELIDCQCWSMLYSTFISCNCDFSKFWCGLGEDFFLRYWSAHLKLSYLFKIPLCVRQGSPQ